MHSLVRSVGWNVETSSGRVLSATDASVPCPSQELRHKSPKTVANSSLPVVVIKNTYVWTAFKFESSAAEYALVPASPVTSLPAGTFPSP